MINFNPSDIITALELMVTGMLTVFFMLCLVILIGRVTIAILNKTYPETVKSDKKEAPGVLTKNKLVALTTAVNIASGGKAKILKIERFN